MRHIIAFLFIVSIQSCFAQSPLDRMIPQLRSENFGSVYQVMDSIINKGKEAIPKLVELLKDTSYVKLKNTADLIYPGAQKYYGHGWIVRYDIDWVMVRAAWLLEEITFQDFGYKEMTISEEMLLKLHQENYREYFKTGSHEVDFKNKTEREKLISYRLMLADSVSKWWERNKNVWTRFDAVKEALSSNEPERQITVLTYLRFDKTECDDLTLESYNKEIKPLVENIRASKNDASEQADYLLRDSSFYWFKIKPKKKGN